MNLYTEAKSIAFATLLVATQEALQEIADKHEVSEL